MDSLNSWFKVVLNKSNWDKTATVTPTSAELSSLTRLFSSAVFHDLAKRGRSALFARLVRNSNLPLKGGARATVGDAFEVAFSMLTTLGRRDEYVYRAAITHKILMGTHSLRTASMLSEFRAGECKADLVILNGTSTVYEIKSERDSLARLAKQVANYKKVFASVNVIVGEGHVDSVILTVPKDVGVICLSRRYQISVVRDAANRPGRICPDTVFQSLRSAEAKSILKALGVDVPDLPNTLRYAAMRDLFHQLRPSDLHAQMVTTLRRTRNLEPLTSLVDQLPQSLHAAALSVPVRRGDHQRLVDAVATPLRDAMAWG
ncbi:sce7726 family protein [Afipia sp. 1NLS2]|uniref:sce7726 family protein n=1 Tax=Afipia sp. 1NLS2 TaxID=666684 RepID=UPI0001DA133F|nr:sce7726 family protein [Afipia sp. 1NLS2]EFI53563.1 putative bacteriophage protein [Afipia sp. 1NLS2]